MRDQELTLFLGMVSTLLLAAFILGLAAKYLTNLP
jgi:hypothetical protein